MSLASPALYLIWDPLWLEITWSSPLCSKSPDVLRESWLQGQDPWGPSEVSLCQLWHSDQTLLVFLWWLWVSLELTSASSVAYKASLAGFCVPAVFNSFRDWKELEAVFGNHGAKLDLLGLSKAISTCGQVSASSPQHLEHKTAGNFLLLQYNEVTSSFSPSCY